MLAVSKTKPVEDIMEAYNSGVRNFAENKVQELIEKKELLPPDIKWHFIGKLQTNKVKYLVGNVELIHSLSSIKLLEKIEAEYKKKNIIANVLIQINIGREATKSGFLEEDLEELLKHAEMCQYVLIRGIMVIIPKGDDASNRKYFKKTKLIYDDLSNRQLSNVEMNILSMGMTSDFKIAIEEGANMIRIGSGIFGVR